MHKTKGYLSTFLIPVVAGLLFVFLATATQQQAIQKRWHLQSAADAMAISAATIMAREMNILAVFNRALIANQVAQAQLLGLSSWYSNIATATDRLATVTSWIPYVNAVTAQLARVVENIDEPLQGFIEIGLIAQEALIAAIQVAQVMVRFSFAQIIPESLAELADIQNIGTEQWSLVHSPGLVEFPWLWWTYIPLQSGANDDERLADLVRNSRDPFSSSRTYNWFEVGIVSAKKTGGTELVTDQNGYWSWQALDTVAIHLELFFFDLELPWGNGAAYRGDEIGSVGAEQFGASADINPQATDWAVNDQNDMGQINTPRYFDRTDLTVSEWPSVVLIFNDVVAKSGARYSRPSTIFHRTDSNPEQANLYNALWEPELQTLTATEKLLISQFRAGNAT